MSHATRSLSRTFVLLDKRLNAVPSKADLGRMVTTGKVRDISFSKSQDADAIGTNLTAAFPSLAGKDLASLEVIKSYARGHAMMKVADGLPSGAQILEHFGGHRKKKVFLYLPPANAVSSNSQANTSSASSSGSNNTATIVTNARSGRPIMTPDVSSLPLPTSTNGSQQHNNSSSTRPIMTPAVSSMSLPSTGFNAASPSMATVVTNASSRQPTVTPAASSLSLPTNGRETRRYLTQMARNSIRADVYPLQIDDSDDGVIALDEVNDNELDRSYLASNPVNVDSACHLTGIHQWQKAGIVKEDQSSLGILNQNAQVPLNDMDRTQEVLSCEHVLMEAASTHEDILLPIFLTLTYEEMCHQARSDRRSMVIVILKGDNIPDVIRILNILRRSNGNAYFWITKENSKSGREVKRKFGSTGSDLLIMAPTTSRPILIERFCGDNLQLAQEEDMVDAMKRAADAVDAFTREWERLEQERSLKREQEISLQKAIENDKTKLIKKSSKKIREARQGRVTQPSLEGEKVTIVLCHSNGKEKRQFNKGAFFQEVYDWAGSNECLPLYFTIQRGREVVRHGDLLERTEVLHICERDEAEIESLLGSKVTFQGNVPDLQSDGELSSTLPGDEYKYYIKK
ncbi:uncharacterized protein [Pocillopora verrucosa]|uniref:uncharacterized protein n=1 Tax=Pocillopora verrucosa TaxID=203993 RepID=UPI0033407DEB